VWVRCGLHRQKRDAVMDMLPEGQEFGQAPGQEFIARMALDYIAEAEQGEFPGTGQDALASLVEEVIRLAFECDRTRRRGPCCRSRMSASGSSCSLRWAGRSPCAEFGASMASIGFEVDREGCAMGQATGPSQQQGKQNPVARSNYPNHRD